MGKIFFAIVMIHLVAGIGYVIYKLEFQKKKKNEED